MCMPFGLVNWLVSIDLHGHSPFHNCLKLSVGGYSHKQATLLSKIMSRMTQFTVNKDRFAIFKEILRRHLNNFRAEQPHTHAIYYCAVLLEDLVWTRDEMAEALKGLLIHPVPLLSSLLFLSPSPLPLLTHLSSSSPLPDVTCEMLESFISKLFSQVHIEALTHGNLTKQVTNSTY